MENPGNTRAYEPRVQVLVYPNFDWTQHLTAWCSTSPGETRVPTVFGYPETCAWISQRPSRSSPSGNSPFTEHWKVEAGVNHEFLRTGRYYTVQGHLLRTMEALWFFFTPSSRIYA
ncbi:uncharacterized protein LOC122574353 [Bombus pyrosoma]|uniref:uncharacterized protein LOC122574353 n=1 Tax=Bombus pyrosoma TaxID=396416 RepID=UPI001CB99883|nr:uncharacterized protein LOC122574353 [Bombus pyrosoma]